MPTIKSLSPKNENFRGWSRIATLSDERQFYVSVTRGKRVRIPYKPRGQNIGFHWHATVTERNGKVRDAFRVPKSLGVRGILRHAGVIDNEDDNNANNS